MSPNAFGEAGCDLVISRQQGAPEATGLLSLALTPTFLCAEYDIWGVHLLPPAVALSFEPIQKEGVRIWLVNLLHSISRKLVRLTVQTQTARIAKTSARCSSR
jgi:hypothetical protein